MTLTLQEANDIFIVFNNLAELHLPIKTSYKIMKLLRVLSTELDFYRDRLQKLVIDCAEIDDDGNIKYVDDGKSIQLKQDKAEEFNTQYTELNNMDIEIIDTILFSLEELEQANLTPKELFQIAPILEEEQ